MTITDALSEVISTIQHEHCVGCRYGKVLIGLRDLRDGAAQALPASAAIPASSCGVTSVSVPVKEQTAAPRVKSQKKTAKTPAPSNAAFTERVRQFLSKHPNSKTREIADALNSESYPVLKALREMGKEVKHSGATSSSRWRLVGNAPLPAPKPAQGNGLKPNVDLNFRCEACRAKFLTQAQLDSHNQVHHDGHTAKATKYECDECGKAFDSLDSLENHIEIKHS